MAGVVMALMCLVHSWQLLLHARNILANKCSCILLCMVIDHYLFTHLHLEQQMTHQFQWVNTCLDTLGFYRRVSNGRSGNGLNVFCAFLTTPLHARNILANKHPFVHGHHYMLTHLHLEHAANDPSIPVSNYMPKHTWFLQMSKQLQEW